MGSVPNFRKGSFLNITSNADPRFLQESERVVLLSPVSFEPLSDRRGVRIRRKLSQSEQASRLAPRAVRPSRVRKSGTSVSFHCCECHTLGVMLSEAKHL